MTDCLECGDDFRLEDGFEDDGMCHECAHAIAEGQISAQVSARELTIRELRDQLDDARKPCRWHHGERDELEERWGALLREANDANAALRVRANTMRTALRGAITAMTIMRAGATDLDKRALDDQIAECRAAMGDDYERAREVLENGE